MSKCIKCGHTLLLGVAHIEYIVPDQEPYEADKREEMDELYVYHTLNVHYCENCQMIHDIWSDEGRHLQGQKA